MRWSEMRVCDGAMGWRVAMVLLAAVATVKAQDTRQVTEPTIPASCVQLSAQLRAMSDKLADADESKLTRDSLVEDLLSDDDVTMT